MEKFINTDDFTIIEKYMVESFYKKLKAPLRNPNIEVKERGGKCYYDEEPHSDFLKDLKLSLEYIEKNCLSTIELFSIPDEGILTGFFDINSKEIKVGDKIKEGCNGLIGTVGWDPKKGTYKLIEYGEGYEIENSDIEWEIIE